MPTYTRPYISGDAAGTSVYACEKCGNDMFAPGAIYCHICGQKLPAGLYTEYREVLQINTEKGK